MACRVLEKILEVKNTKKQQLNILYVIDKYFEIKEGKIPSEPITVFFGAKAAPAYTIAKDIIHLILCVQKIIADDKEVSPYMNVVMVENYNVTLAEKMIPACNISEQISLASKEASGTGNMYAFGESSDTVIKRYEKGDYNPGKYYKENPQIKRAVDFIIGKETLKIGDEKSLNRLFKELTEKSSIYYTS